MDDIFAWLASIVGPLAKRVLTSLGIGWITYEGVSESLDAARSAVLAAWGGLSGTVLDLLSLAGMGTALGIILGAVAARAGLAFIARLGRLTA